jgi:hypothetical protein
VDRPVELVPLVCLRCNTPLPAEADEAAWVCANCGQGMHLDLKAGLERLDVNYHAGIPQGATGRPYWVVERRVELRQRDSYGRGDSAGPAFWSQPRRFFVPAYTASLEDLLAAGLNLLERPPALQPGPPARFQPVTRAAEDVRAAAEFLVMAVEAGRTDKLKKLDFILELGQVALWILPG